MDTKQNSSPEERLLRLIRNRPADTEASELKSIQFYSNKKKVSNDFGTKKANENIIKQIEALKLLNKGLGFLLCLIWLSLLLSLTLSLKKHSYDKKLLSEKNEFIHKEISIQPFSYYSDILNSRNIFLSQEYKQEDTNNPAVLNIALEQLLGNYSLLGIVNDFKPQAIIEDKNSKKTYFLNKGQFINNIKIEDIKDGKVILKSQNQTFELGL